MSGSPEDNLAAMKAKVTVSEPGVEAEQRSELKCFDANDFVNMTLKPRAFVLEPILRTGSLAMLSAFRGIGKTHVAIGIAHAVATGGAFQRWNAPKPRHVLCVDGEMPGADLFVQPQ